MYRRNNSSGVLPTSHDSSGPHNNGSSYRPNYPAPPNYATGIPRSSGSMESLSSKSRKKQSSWITLPQWAYWIVIFVLSFWLLMNRSKVVKVQKKLDKAIERNKSKSRSYDRDRGNSKVDSAEMKKLQQQYEAEKTKAEANLGALVQLQQKNKQLEVEKTDLMLELEHHELEHHGEENGDLATSPDVVVLRENYEKLQKREDALYNRITSLQEKIKRESAREVIERFGEGPHYVRFNVRLPESLASETFPELSNFVVKMAPISEMPHSVHLFLEQVEHGLWENCSFVINAYHILQIGPHSFSVKSNKLKPFQEKKLDKVAFQEYHENNPHVKYALGFAGRPGGPDFYINKIDNTKNHGPGGQDHHDLEEEADPSFAKIIGNIPFADMLFELPTRGAQKIVKDEVTIESMELLQNYVEETNDQLRQN